MYKYIAAVSTGKKSLVDRIIPFFSSWNYFLYLLKAVSFYNLSSAEIYAFFSSDQNNILNLRAFLEAGKAVVKYRFLFQSNKLFLYFTVHSLSLACCQYNSCTIHFISLLISDWAQRSNPSHGGSLSYIHNKQRHRSLLRYLYIE